MALVQQCSVLLPLIDGQELPQLYQFPWGGSWTSFYSSLQKFLFYFPTEVRDFWPHSLILTAIIRHSLVHSLEILVDRSCMPSTIQMLPVIVSRSPEDPRVCLVNLRILL